MTISASVDVRIEFYDIDPMNVVWHGNYPKFLERARCALLDLIGYSYNQMRDSGFAFPVVDMRIKYIRPIRFEQVIRVEATLVEWENRLRINYLIIEPETGAIATKAQTTQLAVNLATNETHFECPSELLSKVAARQ